MGAKPYHRAEVDAERKHLEGLLKDRINFYIVFASVFMAGLSGTGNDKLKAIALAAATLVSFLMALAVVRTHRLVKQALAEIREHDPKHPYTRYQKAVKFSANANSYLVLVPCFLTGFFLSFTILTFLHWR